MREELKDVKRISIVGGPGTGKTTLAQRLSNILKIPATHLDSVNFKPNWEKIPTEERDNIILEKSKEEYWIIDGNYQRTLEMRVKESDTIFLLDFPTEVCLEGAKSRIGKKREDLKIIVCHLGNGASVSAVDHGKCVDTSMGLTPLEGLIMGTRSGDMDPAICDFICQKEGLTSAEMNTVLNKKSGVLGMSGVSSDFRDVEAAANEGNHQAAAALDAFYYRVAKYIGAYTAAMNGVDVVAFTAGVGENNIGGRVEICKYLGYLGTEIDLDKNNVRGEERIISKDGSKVTLMAIPTNEELAIARQTLALVK